MLAKLKGLATLANATFVVSLVLFTWLVWYFYTGRGGPSELACYLIPFALVLQILFTRQNGPLYKWLPSWARSWSAPPPRSRTSSTKKWK